VLGHPQPHRNSITQLKPEEKPSAYDPEREAGREERSKLNNAHLVQTEARSEPDGECKLATLELGAPNETTGVY